jgi:putative endonuclease
LGYFVYILRSQSNGSLYVGQTNNLPRRLAQHNNPHARSYAAARGPWTLAHSEEFADRPAAVRRERHLKSPAGSREKRRLAGVMC